MNLIQWADYDKTPQSMILVSVAILSNAVLTNELALTSKVGTKRQDICSLWSFLLSQLLSTFYSLRLMAAFSYLA